MRVIFAFKDVSTNRDIAVSILSAHFGELIECCEHGLVFERGVATLKRTSNNSIRVVGKNTSS